MLLVCAPMTWAQSTPDMASAPHYRQLLTNDQVRVFALTLRPLERTMARHDRNFLVVALLDSDVVIWPEGESNIALVVSENRTMSDSPSGQITTSESSSATTRKLRSCRAMVRSRGRSVSANTRT